MNYKSRIAELPKGLIQKLVKMPSFQDAFLNKTPWSEENLDQLFKDAHKNLNHKEQEQFYHALLQDVTFATYSEWQPKIKRLKKLVAQNNNVSSKELSEYASKTFAKNSNEYKEVQTLTRDVQYIIIILCNTHKALNKIQRTPSEELKKAVQNIFSLADNANVFNTMINLYNDCGKILQNYNKPSSGNKNRFDP